LKITDLNIRLKNQSDRCGDDFKHYEFREKCEIVPLEEIVVPGNNFNDHCLYVFTHCPSFANLKILDLRDNKISSLLTLNVKTTQRQREKEVQKDQAEEQKGINRSNLSGLTACNLKELYLSTKVASKTDAYDISFFFLETIEVLKNLQVLWIEAKRNNLYAITDDSELNPVLARQLRPHASNANNPRNAVKN